MAAAKDSSFDGNGQEDQDDLNETVENNQSSKNPDKKQKTPEQIERERMRRRRRRQRQRIMRSIDKSEGGKPQPKPSAKPEGEKTQQKPPVKPEAPKPSVSDKAKQEEVSQKQKEDEKLKSEKARTDAARKEQDKQKSEKDKADSVRRERERQQAQQMDVQKKDDEKKRQQDLNDSQKEDEQKKIMDQKKKEQDRLKKDETKKIDQEKKQQEQEKKNQEQQKKEDEQRQRDAALREQQQQPRDETHSRIVEGDTSMNFEKPSKEEELKNEKPFGADNMKFGEDLQPRKEGQKEKDQKVPLKPEVKKENMKAEKPEEPQKIKEEKLEVKPKEPEKTEQLKPEQEEPKELPPVEVEEPKEQPKTSEAEVIIGEPKVETLYEPEPSYITHSFSYEEPKKESEPEEKDETEDENLQPEPELELKPEDEIQVEPEELPAEQINLDEEEPDEEIISSDVVENEDQEKPEEPVVETTEEPTQPEEVPSSELPTEEEKNQEEAKDEEVSPELPDADKDKEVVLPAEPENELVLGDENQEAPPIPLGKMREDHGTTIEATPIYEDDNRPKDREQTQEGSGLLSETKENESKEATKEEEELKQKAAPSEEALNEKKSPAVEFASFLAKGISEALKKAGPVITGLFGKIGGFLKNVFGKLNIRMVGGIAVVVIVLGLGYFGYTQKYHEQAWGFVTNTWNSFFTPKAEKPKVEVKPDANDERRFGITTALLFAKNKGAALDYLTADIRNALYYGALQEPKVKGETGISAATYYGGLKDEAGFVNLYVAYVDHLNHMQELYKTDVYAMLDRGPNRDEVLLQHLDELKAVKEKGLQYQQQIGIDLDDLKVSYDSLNGEKNKSESDFFAALQDLQGQKSDTLLKQFIDVSQKQLALKARISALSKLVDYYKTALGRLDTRIEAIDKNRDALIQGIKVVDIPGADLDLIIRQK